jgi:hypothetical protein
VSSRSSGRRVEAHGYAPSDDLADAVATLWSGRWDLREQSPHVTELVSDPCVHVVFEASEQNGGNALHYSHDFGKTWREFDR